MSFSLFDTAPDPGSFRILTVCTGNICRSPLAESLLRMVLGGLPISVSSAGTHALVGAQMTAQNQRIAADLGVPDAAAHRSRQLTADLVREADLVLALSREHRRDVVELLPRASRHTFTLREFARLAEAVTDDELADCGEGSAAELLRGAVEVTAQLRGTLPLLDDPADDDVVDPYQQGDDVYTRSAEQLVPAVNATATLLRRAAAGVA